MSGSFIQLNTDFQNDLNICCSWILRFIHWRLTVSDTEDSFTTEWTTSSHQTESKVVFILTSHSVFSQCVHEGFHTVMNKTSRWTGQVSCSQGGIFYTEQTKIMETCQEVKVAATKVWIDSWGEKLSFATQKANRKGACEKNGWGRTADVGLQSN